MKMSLATETIDTVIHGTGREKAEAVLKFAMFYAAITFAVSVAFFYLSSIESTSITALVGLVISLVAGFFKFGH